MQQTMQATFSMLIMSIASSAATAMGLSPDPQSGEFSKDKNMARFNIDLLLMLKEKSKNNLTEEEQKFLDTVISDLQIKFVSI